MCVCCGEMWGGGGGGLVMLAIFNGKAQQVPSKDTVVNGKLPTGNVLLNGVSFSRNLVVIFRTENLLYISGKFPANFCYRKSKPYFRAFSTEYPEPGTPFDRKFPAGNVPFTTVKSQTTSKSDLGNTSDLPEIMIDVIKGEHHYFCQKISSFLKVCYTFKNKCKNNVCSG